KWLEAHYDPLANLYTFSSCIALGGTATPNSSQLVVGDLGTGVYNMKLKVYRGTSLVSENTLLDLPTGLVAFLMDQHEPRTPAVAVASGPFIYIYKNLRPYFKFTLPPLEVNALEQEVWSQAREDKIDPMSLKEMLEGIREKADVPLSVRSLKFLRLLRDLFVPLKVVSRDIALSLSGCVMSLPLPLRGTGGQNRSQSLVIIIIIITTTTFLLISVYFSCLSPSWKQSGARAQGDMRFRGAESVLLSSVCVCYRESTKPKYCIELSSHPVGLVRVGKNVVVGCTQETLHGFTQKGKKLWTAYLPAPITTMSLMDHHARGFQAVLVGLTNCQVHMYCDKNLVGVIKTPDMVTSICFGRYGREDGALIMTTKGTHLAVQTEQECASPRCRDEELQSPAGVTVGMRSSRVLRVLLDEELQSPAGVTVTGLAAPVSSSPPERGSASLARARACRLCSPVPCRPPPQVQGLGPSFKLTLNIQNTAACRPVMNLAVSFLYDESLYSMKSAFFKV
uniref:Bardet-Biedl syndrome 1 n=1 Tax=Lepisosteus oculatus TaxID=7918 RepID=W5M3R4_LEPOC